ncbi:PrsW family intramembrane metalloprotease [Streptomyces sp. SID8352]|uniref:PrsW family intramembrane metalloprotease n=1 Tax=Streptomyces sp. SID8352 TaxID=2690338 RepID=UPI00136DF85E|nr:PrsW family intramembrane metalloprotease [Streptomyces sp. SID8352]MYU21215.1 PrsW family intramembrane metalloprotease [Streptomyces sp. SID8352]
MPHPARPPRPHWWHRARVRYGALGTLLALSGLVILALVRRQTGADGFLVGLGLAVLPVPLLVGAFHWLDRVDPRPWRNLLFCFAWGACAAALIAIVANSFATRWIATATADPSGADTLGATVIAPVVEESAKAAAVLLLFLFRRRHFTGLLDGVVTAGVTATGFAFTENILYLGEAFGTDQAGGEQGVASVVAATFFVRVVMSPFAHPLFTVLTGIGFGLAALRADRPGSRRARRALLPLTGLLLAMGVHALWNGSVTFGKYGFFVVYGVFMAPAFGLLTWLVIRSRQRELRTVRTELPVYVQAGWLGPFEPFALGSVRGRRAARQYARRHGGRAAERAVAEYGTYTSALAYLRRKGRLGRAGADYQARERLLLDALWERREAARPALDHAARATSPRPPYPVPPWPHPHAAHWPQGHHPYVPYVPHPAHAPYGHPAPAGYAHSAPYTPYTPYGPFPALPRPGPRP